MDKGRKRSITSARSPRGRKSSTGRSTVRSRSKSGGRAANKDAKTRTRSKSRTKKEARSRSRARAVSESPGPITRSQTRSSSRSRAPSQTKKADSPVNSATYKIDNLEVNFQSKPKLVLRDVYHDDYTSNSDYSEIYRRSLSKDLPEPKRSVERERAFDRNPSANHDGNSDKNYGVNRGRNYDRSYDRTEDRAYSRNVDRGYSQNVDRGYGQNVDRAYVRSADRNYDGGYERASTERNYDRRFDRNFERMSQDRHSSASRRFPSLAREASEHKEADGFEKDVPAVVSNVKIPKIAVKSEWSLKMPTWIRALVGIFALPPLVILLHLSCTREQCTLSKFHIPRNVNYYLNYNSAMIVVGFVLVQIALSLLSIGKKVGGPPGINGTLMYRCNGLLSTFLSAGIVAALWHFNYPVTVVYDKMMSIMVSSAMFAYVLGIALFVKGGRASVTALNPEGISENFLYQFSVGREINPLLFNKINVKTLLMRISFNALALLNGLAILKTYEMKSEPSYTLLVCLILSTFSIIDFFWYENTFPSTFEAMYEGTGCYLALTYMLLPFFPTLVTKYIMLHKVQVPAYGLCAIVLAWIFGFCIYRGSNLQKAAFRRNPLNPALAHFETISTSRGKKLLTSGWWGFVRHPNYLGTMILHWSWAFVAGHGHAIPYVFTLLMTLSLINRAVRVDSYCRDRYQAAWEQYCSRVPYRIIPRIF